MRKDILMKTTLKLASATTLALLVACGGGGGSDSSTTPSGGGGTSNAATKMVYTDPTPSSGQWALMKDAASTDTHLVLKLVPPSDASSGFGVGFTVGAPSSLVWSKVSSGDATMIHNLAYTLGSGTQLIKGVIKSGSLVAGVYQQGLATTAVAHSSGAVASIAVDMASGASKTTSPITPTVSVSKELQLGGMQTITIAVGQIALQ